MHARNQCVTHLKNGYSKEHNVWLYNIIRDTAYTYSLVSSAVQEDDQA